MDATNNPMPTKDGLIQEKIEQMQDGVHEAHPSTLPHTDDGQTTENTPVDAVADASEKSKAQLYEQLQQLLDTGDALQIKNQVEAIRQAFYKKSKAETDRQKAAFLADGGDELDFIPSPTELENEFKALVDQYRYQRTKLIAQQEQEKENNLLRKNHIIEQMKSLIESSEDAAANINTFRELQQEWKKTGAVPTAAVNDLWKRYNQCQEAFWDLIKISNELREYDFKKNLEAKTRLIEQIEALDSETDVIHAFRQLQRLHEEWHELGPVARDLRDQIRQRLKTASSNIYKKHQLYFELLRQDESKNLETKAAICERLEAIDPTTIQSHKAWDEANQQVMAMQEEWRQTGFAPRKENQKLSERYRQACASFFAAKNAFYKAQKAIYQENLARKKALCIQAEALKESTEWKETSEALAQLQKEWKTIGPIPQKASSELWNRFIAACDYFFEQRNKDLYSQKNDENENLEKKKALIERIKAFEKTDNPGESLTALRTLAAEWNTIGHVPFKEKDALYKAFRDALNAQFDALNVSAAQRRLESFKNNLKDMTQKGEDKLYREREKMVRAYEHLKSEIATYENNIGFLSVSSKKGGGLLQEMERKIASLKEECRLLEQKIELIDANI